MWGTANCGAYTMKSDLELISAFRRGDDAAYLQLVRRYHVGVLNFLTALTQNPNISDELTQTVFLLVLRELHPRKPDVAINVPQLPPPAFVNSEKQHGDGAGRVALYVYRAAYACWSAYQQRVAPTVSVTANQNPAALVSQRNVGFESTPTPASPAAADAPYSMLPEHLRSVLALKEVCGLTYAQISGVLLVPSEEVALRVHAAYTLLLDANTIPARQSGAHDAAALPPPMPPQAGQSGA